MVYVLIALTLACMCTAVLRMLTILFVYSCVLPVRWALPSASVCMHMRGVMGILHHGPVIYGTVHAHASLTARTRVR